MGSLATLAACTRSILGTLSAAGHLGLRTVLTRQMASRRPAGSGAYPKPESKQVQKENDSRQRREARKDTAHVANIHHSAHTKTEAQR